MTRRRSVVPTAICKDGRIRLAVVSVGEGQPGGEGFVLRNVFMAATG